MVLLKQILLENISTILKISATLFPFSLIFNLYQYRENKRNQKYRNEKELELKKIELAKEDSEYLQKLDNPINISLYSDLNKLESEHIFNTNRLKVEIKYLEKVLGKQ